GFNVLVVSTDCFTRGLTRIFVVPPHVRHGLHRDFLRAAMTSMLNEQRDEQPDDGDRCTGAVLEVWVSNPIQELLLVLFPKTAPIGVTRIDLAQDTFVPRLACLAPLCCLCM